MNPRLIAISGPAEGQTFPFRGERFTVGRQADNDLQLTSLEVSRYHCELLRGREGGYTVVDLDSRHGVFVNSRPVRRRRLVHSDLVTVGGSVLVFLLDDSSVSASAVPQTPFVAHQDLVIHRDLKPGNILVDVSGNPKLLDFGIAKLLETDDVSGTATDRSVQLAMTMRYASPEQLNGEPIGTASDIYSLGVVLYQVLTGRLPCGLEGRDRAELMVAVSEEDPALPSTAIGLSEEVVRDGGVLQLTPESVSRVRDGDPNTLRRRLAGDVDSILAKALRKEPRNRYASVEQLAADLRRHLGDLPVLAREGNVTYRAAKFVRRHRLGLASLAAMLLLAIGFTVALVSQLHETERARDRAESVSDFLIEAAAPNRPAGEEPSVRDLLDRGRHSLEVGLEREPEVRATLLFKLGEIYDQLGDYTAARGLLEESVTLLRRQHAGDHPDLATAINDLAAVHYWTGENAQAEALYRESIAIRRRLGLEDDLIKPMSNLAAILMARGELDEAREIYGESLTLRRAALQAASPRAPPAPGL